MTKHEPPEVRRAQILAALVRVLAREGVAGVSVRTVAAEAGLSPGALRHHFPSQESLLSASLASGLDAAIAGPDTVDDPDPAVRLARAVEQFLPLTPAGLDAVRVLVGLVSVSAVMPAVGATVGQLYGRTRGIVEGWFDGHADPVAAADEVLALIDGVSLNLLVGATTPERARALVLRRARGLVAGADGEAHAGAD